jgi:hypothetical protein
MVLDSHRLKRLRSTISQRITSQRGREVETAARKCLFGKLKAGEVAYSREQQSDSRLVVRALTKAFPKK